MRRAVRSVWLAGALAVTACSGQSNDAPSRAAADASPTRSVATGDSVGATPAVKTPESEWQIVPGRAGPVTRETSEAELRQHYGSGGVESTRVEIGEGETAAGVVLYPGDSLRRAEIVWQDSVNRRRPARLSIRGNRTLWQLPRGISLGTNLQELERLNGRSFTLAGFGWDYAGVITDWKGGTLDSSLAGIKLYLDPGPAQYESKAYSQVLGDGDFSSSLAPMQQLNPHVATIFVDFERP
jgi:hypothetical protein